MKVTQHSARKGHTNFIADLEAGIKIRADIVCLQEPLVSVRQGNSMHAGVRGTRGNMMGCL
jgi:hypothetical protein